MFFLFVTKDYPGIILELLHFYGELHLKSKTGLNRDTAIFIPLPLLSWYVDICEYITTYNCEHITNEVIVIYDSNEDILRILTGKKKRQIKLKRLQKVRMWAFGSLVHQISSLKEVLNLKQNFQKNKVVTVKTPFFVIGLFCTHHSIYLNTGF